jgi:hypothetical protein
MIQRCAILDPNSTQEQSKELHNQLRERIESKLRIITTSTHKLINFFSLFTQVLLTEINASRTNGKFVRNSQVLIKVADPNSCFMSVNQQKTGTGAHNMASKTTIKT